jgi:hypothetical protein
MHKQFPLDDLTGVVDVDVALGLGLGAVDSWGAA